MDAIIKKQTVCICFAVDNNYAPHMVVALKSILINRNCDFFYDIIVLSSRLSSENITAISSLIKKYEGVDIRVVDVTDETKCLEYNVGSYLTIATNFRLLLFSKMFQEYERIIYLDSDIIVEGDISELYFTDMSNCMVAAVEETGFRQLSLCKKAVFINGSIPYNVDNYRTDALELKHPKRYFNAGVLLLDLEKIRKAYSFDEVLEVLHKKKYHYNDQDVLNILFNDYVKLLDYEWNYQNNVDLFYGLRPDYEQAYAQVRRDNPKIIHYVSGTKPWNSDVELGDRYWFYQNKK